MMWLCTCMANVQYSITLVFAVWRLLTQQAQRQVSGFDAGAPARSMVAQHAACIEHIVALITFVLWQPCMVPSCLKRCLLLI